jgi:hypothetical protein
MYSAADYVEMLIIYGECGNEVNPHALFSRAFQQRFYINLWVGLLGNRVVLWRTINLGRQISDISKKSMQATIYCHYD